MAAQPQTAAALAEYRVNFTWLDTYGRRRRVQAIVEAMGETLAVIEARAKINELYVISNARFVSVERVVWNQKR